MDYKYSTSPKAKQKSSFHSSEDLKTFKNENVVFKIHSGKDDDNIYAKNFPAKFSINITNETNELGTGKYNMDQCQPNIHTSRFEDIPLQDLGFKHKTQNYSNLSKVNSPFNSSSKNRTPRSSQKPTQKPINYEQKLGGFKKQYERLQRQYEENGEQYEKYIYELETKLSQKQQENGQYHQRNHILNKESFALKRKIEELQAMLANQRDKNQQLFLKLQKKQKNNENQRDKQNLRQLKNKHQKQLAQLRKNLQKKELNIRKLQQALLQKEKTIKKLTQFNNQLCQKLLSSQSELSKTKSKQMQKWLRNMSKIFTNQSKSSTNYTEQLIQKCEYLTSQVKTLASENYKLEQQMLQTKRMSNNLEKQNQTIRDNFEVMERKRERSQQNLYKNSNNSFRNSSFSNVNTFCNTGDIQQTGDGIVKVKMQKLLQEKDKRISNLQNENMDIKNENIFLKNQFYTNSLQSQVYQSIQNASMNQKLYRARSQENFFRKNKVKQMYEDVQDKYLKFSSTIGNFIDIAQKGQTEEYPLKERLSFKSAKSECQNADIDKLKKIMTLQQSAFEEIQQFSKKNQDPVIMQLGSQTDRSPRKQQRKIDSRRPIHRFKGNTMYQNMNAGKKRI